MADADTFPKLLDLNATRFAGRPAIREKQYGIWQGWTWAVHATRGAAGPPPR